MMKEDTGCLKWKWEKKMETTHTRTRLVKSRIPSTHSTVCVVFPQTRAVCPCARAAQWKQKYEKEKKFYIKITPRKYILKEKSKVS